MPESDLDKFIGEYELAPGFTFTVTREGAQLYCQATGQERLEVFPESPVRFFFKVVDAVIEFQVDAAGAVGSMVLFQSGQDVKGKRVK